MSLPDGGKTPWPPEAARKSLRLMREWSAWWSSDPEQLMNVYGHMLGGQDLGVSRQNLFQRFWARIAGGLGAPASSDRQRAYLHVPLAADIAASSAALLFSEAPLIQVAEAHEAKASSQSKAAEEELTRIRSEGGLDSRLLEGADFAAGLGGVYLKPTWDTELADIPLLSVVQPDQAWPEFRHGLLVAVTLWREVDRSDRDMVIRHLERHEMIDGKPVVLHALYQGSGDELGTQMDDAELLAKTNLEPRVDLPFAGLGIHYVPNARPNRRLRGSPQGQADYAGAEGLLDALDETYASWMRDVRLGKARILADRGMLTSRGTFDLDHEVYSSLDTGGGTANTPMKDRIHAHQFSIRVDEHSKTALSLIERIVSGPYSPQTFGLNIEGRAESGTALNIRERKTFMTQQRKGAWWGMAIAGVTEQMLVISREVFKTGVTVFRPRVTLSDSIAPDARQLAETVEILNRAEAVSTQVKVEMQHPDWEPDQVSAEVTRIQAEKGLAVAPPDEPPVA